jgi:hypothetical protein
MTAANFIAEMHKVMADGEPRRLMLADYTELRKQLGPVGASDRVAERVIRLLN